MPHKANLTHFFYLFAIFFLFSCTTRPVQENSSLLKKIELEIEQSKAFKVVYDSLLQPEQNVYLSELLVNSYITGDTVVLFDPLIRQAFLLRNGSVFGKIDEKDYPMTSGRIHSIFFSEDTTIIVQNKPVAIVKTLKDTIFSYNRIKAFEGGQLNQVSRVRKLENGFYLAPIGRDLMKSFSDNVNQMGKSTVKKVIKEQSLFAVFDESGTYFTFFGEFPGLYNEKELQYTCLQPYHFAVHNKHLFVVFPLIPVLYQYNLSGELISQYDLELQDYNFPDQDSEAGLYDTIDGFAIIEDEEFEGEIPSFFIKTMSVDDGKQTVYRYDLKSKRRTSYKFDQLSTIGVSLNKSSFDQWAFIEVSLKEKNPRLRRIVFSR